MLSLAEKNHTLMVSAVVIENFGLGLVTAAMTAFLMAMCNKRFTATQFALLSSLMAASRDILVAPAGKIAEGLGGRHSSSSPWRWLSRRYCCCRSSRHGRATCLSAAAPHTGETVPARGAQRRLTSRS